MHHSVLPIMAAMCCSHLDTIPKHQSQLFLNRLEWLASRKSYLLIVLTSCVGTEQPVLEECFPKIYCLKWRDVIRPHWQRLYYIFCCTWVWQNVRSDACAQESRVNSSGFFMRPSSASVSPGVLSKLSKQFPFHIRETEMLYHIESEQWKWQRLGWAKIRADFMDWNIKVSFATNKANQQLCQTERHKKSHS